jgi:hypothetical protein
MGKCEETFNELNQLADKHNITFDCFLGRHLDCGEICFEFNEKEGFVLFSYDRAEETYRYSTMDLEELKYTLFEKLCLWMGFDYEVKHRITNLNLDRDDNDLDSDTRKVAFEYTLSLLNKISPTWMERTIPEYERYLNKWRKDKDVYFDIGSMSFKVREAQHT